MDQLPQSHIATAYIAMQVHAFDKWSTAAKIIVFFSQTQNAIIIRRSHLAVR